MNERELNFSMGFSPAVLVVKSLEIKLLGGHKKTVILKNFQIICYDVTDFFFIKALVDTGCFNTRFANFNRWQNMHFYIVNLNRKSLIQSKMQSTSFQFEPGIFYNYNHYEKFSPIFTAYFTSFVGHAMKSLKVLKLQINTFGGQHVEKQVI